LVEAVEVELFPNDPQSNKPEFNESILFLDIDGFERKLNDFKILNIKNK